MPLGQFGSDSKFRDENQPLITLVFSFYELAETPGKRIQWDSKSIEGAVEEATLEQGSQDEPVSSDKPTTLYATGGGNCRSGRVSARGQTTVLCLGGTFCCSLVGIR